MAACLAAALEASRLATTFSAIFLIVNPARYDTFSEGAARAAHSTANAEIVIM
jgi:hypothetical protein